MKTICLVRDGRPFWQEVESYLKAVNARVFASEYKTLQQDILSKKPEIVIAGERSYREVLSIAQFIPKLIIYEGKADEINTKDVYFLRWPEGRSSFLEITSRLLYISERREFKTVINISFKDRKETFLGKSVNFSMTGMAFKFEKDMNLRDIVTVSFFLPGNAGRISIEAEVMRQSTNPDDKTTYYGARFLNLSGDTKNILENFIKKIR